ncbi:F-box domain containing protein [Tanacetum coccineum]|uniref:F-box domain containing protein n=1 Tax=Tanacetum coccineum TaxID=301880 RepID=A0ABQ5J789_9ASTR
MDQSSRLILTRVQNRYAVIVISIDVKKVVVCAGVPRQRGHLNALECLNEPLKPLQGNKGEKGGIGQGEIWRFSLLLLHLLQLGGLDSEEKKSKKYKSSGGSSFNTRELGDDSFNLNSTAGDEKDEVYDLYNVKKDQEMTKLLQTKKLELKAAELEILGLRLVGENICVFHKKFCGKQEKQTRETTERLVKPKTSLIQMIYGNDQAKRMNEESDRLSILPDDLIHKILSFIDIVDAIRTSVLSSRWRYVWATMPYLNFSNENSPFNRTLFSEFVTDVLPRRNNQIEVYSVKLSFREMYPEVTLKLFLDYAFSHNVQQLSFSCVLHKNIDFPLYLFRSPNLKYLRLTGVTCHIFEFPIALASTWELPALTTLHLDSVCFYDDNSTDKGIRLISKCVNLKSLTINRFTMIGSDDLNICHPRLSSLTLENGHWALCNVNIVTPQLENLCMMDCWGKQLIYAPKLASLVIKDDKPLEFTADDLCSLEKVNLCIYPDKKDPYKIAAMLQRLHNVKFLKLNMELIEFLSSSMKPFSLQSSPFANLKSLKIYPGHIPSDEQAQIEFDMSTEVKNYFLAGSPSATLTVVSRRVVRALANATSAENLMAQLQVMLKNEKANIETNKAHMDRGKTSKEADMLEQGKTQTLVKVQLNIEGTMTQIKTCLEDLSVQIDKGRTNICCIISKLHDIEVLLLKELPPSKRDKLQACYSSLRAEADTVVKKMIDCMTIQQSHLNDCFHELAKTSLLSS